MVHGQTTLVDIVLRTATISSALNCCALPSSNTSRLSRITASSEMSAIALFQVTAFFMLGFSFEDFQLLVRKDLPTRTKRLSNQFIRQKGAKFAKTYWPYDKNIKWKQGNVRIWLQVENFEVFWWEKNDEMIVRLYYIEGILRHRRNFRHIRGREYTPLAGNEKL